MSVSEGGSVVSSNNKSATVPFGISLRRNSGGSPPPVLPPVVLANPPVEAPPSPAREKTTTAAAIPQSTSRSPERRKRDSVALADLIDPLMSDESRRIILESQSTIDLGGAPRVPEDNPGVHGAPESSPRETQRAKPIPSQGAGVSKIQQRQNKSKAAREASSAVAATNAAATNNVSILATPKPIIDSGAAGIGQIDGVGSFAGNSTADASESAIPVESAKKKGHTEAQISEMLQGYFQVSDSHRELLSEGMQIRYFRVGSEPKPARFVRGGYIRNISKGNMYIENLPGGRRGAQGYFCYTVKMDGIAEIWKRYDPRVTIEVAIIQQLLKDQRMLINSLQQQVSVLEKQRITPK